MLRYGDGTPFPFEDAFLDMLVDAVEACATALAATAHLDRKRAEAEAVLQAIGEEERRLLMFERAVAAACEPGPDGEATPAMRAAEQTRSAMQAAVELSREQLRQISAEKAAPPSWHRTARRVQAAVARFFASRLLPDTRWAWAWDVSGPAPRAEVASQDPRFRVVFDLEVPPAWQAPVRIDSLAPDLVVQLPRRRWLRTPVETAIPLGRCFLVAARHDERGHELVIRKPDGSGWRIDLPRDSQPSAAALDRRGREVGSGLVRETELAALISAIDRELPTMRLPRQARDVLLDGTSVNDIPDTTLAVRALLDAIGPTVREIRNRSRMPGELTLKRDVADGVREELFVSRATLTASYASLPAEYRRLLDDAGFGRGLTTGLTELVDQSSQPAILARATPAPPPAPAHSTSPALAARPSSPAPAAALAETVPAEAVRARPSPTPRTRRETQPLVLAPLVPAPPVRPSHSPTQPRIVRVSAEELRRSADPTMPSILAAPPFRRLATPTG
jgi:hypothetical protein